MNLGRNWLRVAAVAAALALGGVPIVAGAPVAQAFSPAAISFDDPDGFFDEFETTEREAPDGAVADAVIPDVVSDDNSVEDLAEEDIAEEIVAQDDADWRLVQTEDFTAATTGIGGLSGINGFWTRFGNPTFQTFADPEDAGNRILLIGRRSPFDGLAGASDIFELGKTYRVQMRARLATGGPAIAAVGFGLTSDPGWGPQTNDPTQEQLVPVWNWIAPDRWSTIAGFIRFDERSDEWRLHIWSEDVPGLSGYGILVDDLDVYEFVGAGAPPIAPLIPGPPVAPEPEPEPTDPPVDPADPPLIVLPVLPAEPDEESLASSPTPTAPEPTASAPTPESAGDSRPMPGSGQPNPPSDVQFRFHPLPEAAVDDAGDDFGIGFHGDRMRRAEPENPEILTHTATYPEVDYAEELGGGISAVGLVVSLVSAVAVLVGGGYVIWRKPWQQSVA